MGSVDNGSRRETSPTGHSRGRNAKFPWRIPAAGWKDILVRVKHEVQEDKLPLLAAGVTYYAVIGLFPALIALVSLYGLVADPHEVVRQLSDLSLTIPGGAREILIDQLTALAASSERTLSLGLAGSVAVALWSASSGISVLMQGINTAYDEPRSWGFLRGRLLALGFALGSIVFLSIVLSVTGGLAFVLEHYELPPPLPWLLPVLRWVVLATAAAFGLTVCYRYAPRRARAQMRWISPGALVATLLWLLITALFGGYVRSFGSYNETYGALAGGVVLMMWLYFTNFVILLGAELNAEIEAQTAVDSTVGEPRPMGERNAVKADCLGAAATSNTPE